MRGKIRVKRCGGQKYKIKVRYLAVALAAIIGTCHANLSAQAEECVDLRVVFARGSGGELNNDRNYLEFKETIKNKLQTTQLSYEFIDLDYPAVGIGIDKLDTALGAYFGAGEAYEFGDSVKSGVKKLDKMVNSNSCPHTKYVLGGYSQGAMVVSKALSKLNPDKIIYAATFGDPKLYLPEGEGIMPPACYGQNLSDYRTYVPDCRAFKGLLGAYVPYEPTDFAGKLGTWCNKNDIFCSSHLSISDHTAYIDENLYEDASRVIFDKITQYFGLKNKITSPHDTAIVIDSTNSMQRLINQYKEEALRLAQETLSAGGRVALYDYRDLDDPYEPVEHCNFETCTLETFMRGLEEITVDGGGDVPESLLSASFHVMQNLTWKRGSTKSLIVLTNGGFLSPDRDGITYQQAVQLSKTIDPVNFYIITRAGYLEVYQALAEDTGGLVVTEPRDFSLLTDYIMARYDTLPRVEEDDSELELPELNIDDIEYNEYGVKVRFFTDSEGAIVMLDDTILGISNTGEFEIIEMDPARENNLRLVPIKNGLRGEGIETKITLTGATLKAPNTGQL